MNKKLDTLRILTFCQAALVILLLAVSCARQPGRPVREMGLPPGPPPAQQESEKKQPDGALSLERTLSREAEQFLSQGNHRDALTVFELLLSKTEEGRKLPVLSRIEAALADSPPEVIREWLEKDGGQIPKPLLMYYAGMGYALENNPAEASALLTAFTHRYPDHYHYYNALELLDVVQKALFRKNTIGCLLPMTGRYASFGERALSGVQLALDDLSKRYEKEFRMIVFDTRADPEVAVQGVRQLHQQNIAGILGPLLVENEAALEAESLQIPMIVFSQKHDLSMQGEYLFNNFISPEMQIRSLFEHFAGRLGLKTAAILYPEERYGIRYKDIILDMAGEFQISVIAAEPYDGKKTEFSGPILKIKKRLQAAAKESIPTDSEAERPESDHLEEDPADVQILFIPDSFSRVNLILPQLAFNDVNPRYLAGTNLWHDESFLKGSRGYHREVVIPDGFFENSRNPAGRDFAKRYRSVFNTSPQFLEAIAYDTALILWLTAMDEAVASRADLKQALQAGRVYHGATGPTSFDASGQADRPVFLITIKNESFVEISP